MLKPRQHSGMPDRKAFISTRPSTSVLKTLPEAIVLLSCNSWRRSTCWYFHKCEPIATKCDWRSFEQPSKINGCGRRNLTILRHQNVDCFDNVQVNFILLVDSCGIAMGNSPGDLQRHVLCRIMFVCMIRQNHCCNRETYNCKSVWTVRPHLSDTPLSGRCMPSM